jgi:hypothetical protein
MLSVVAPCDGSLRWLTVMAYINLLCFILYHFYPTSGEGVKASDRKYEARQTLKAHSRVYLFAELAYWSSWV